MDEDAEVEATAELESDAVLSLRCLSQNAKAGFFLLAWLSGSSMAASSWQLSTWKGPGRCQRAANRRTTDVRCSSTRV